MKKTLKDFTPEIRAKIKGYKERCTKDLYSGKEAKEFNREKSVEYIEKVYSLAKQKYKPVVIFAKNPKQYKVFFELLQKNHHITDEAFFKKNNLKLKPSIKEINYDIKEELKANKIRSHWLTECCVYSRVYFSWYYFIHKEFNLPLKTKANDLKYLYENSLNSISRCYYTKKYCLVLLAPKEITRNATHLHSTTKAAITWGDVGMYYVNGRRIEAKMFEKVLRNKLTFNNFIKINNEDLKAAIVTMIKENKGNDELLKFLNADCVDEREIKHDSGHIEVVKLYKTKEKYSFLQDAKGNFNQPYAWTEMKCPSTGQSYLIDTSAHFNNVMDSIKFHRPEGVPITLDYNFTQFNN